MEREARALRYLIVGHLIIDEVLSSDMDNLTDDEVLRISANTIWPPDDGFKQVPSIVVTESMTATRTLVPTENIITIQIIHGVLTGPSPEERQAAEDSEESAIQRAQRTWGTEEDR